MRMKDEVVEESLQVEGGRERAADGWKAETDGGGQLAGGRN